MTPSDENDPYALLGVRPGATLDEIHAAYEKLSRTLAPGSLALYSLADVDEQRKLQRRIERAYMTLVRLAGHGDIPVAEPIREPAPGDREAVRSPAASADANRTGAADERTATVGGTHPHASAGPAMQPVLAPQGAARTPGHARRPASLKAPLPQPPQIVVEARAAGEFSGALLRRVRESLGLSIEDVAATTRIRPRFLAAIEDENFAALPEQVFARGFVVAFAGALTLDGERVWASFLARWQAARPPT